MRTSSATLVDLFEVRSDTSYAFVPRTEEPLAEPAVEIEVEWDEVPASADESGVRPLPSAPGVGAEAWQRARGWCAE
jgi:hypothetical protein